VLFTTPDTTPYVPDPTMTTPTPFIPVPVIGVVGGSMTPPPTSGRVSPFIPFMLPGDAPRGYVDSMGKLGKAYYVDIMMPTFGAISKSKSKKKRRKSK
jgi:hypothetical protein